MVKTAKKVKTPKKVKTTRTIIKTRQSEEEDYTRPPTPSFIPLGPRVLIIPARVATETQSGLILAVEATKMPEGEVWAVGENCQNVKVGDYVTFGSHAGHVVNTDGEECVVVLEEDVIGRHMGLLS